ncbi:MAG: hypothetical protein KKA19_08435 [Candidatus Margulisbacteria bacterium]|nr:hypothetical protein [Candidatus Margulisiibacteriota bacterium]
MVELNGISGIYVNQPGANREILDKKEYVDLTGKNHQQKIDLVKQALEEGKQVYVVSKKKEVFTFGVEKDKGLALNESKFRAQETREGNIELLLKDIKDNDYGLEELYPDTTKPEKDRRTILNKDRLWGKTTEDQAKKLIDDYTKLSNMLKKSYLYNMDELRVIDLAYKALQEKVKGFIKGQMVNALFFQRQTRNQIENLNNAFNIFKGLREVVNLFKEKNENLSVFERPTDPEAAYRDALINPISFYSDIQAAAEGGPTEMSLVLISLIKSDNLSMISDFWDKGIVEVKKDGNMIKYDLNRSNLHEYIKEKMSSLNQEAANLFLENLAGAITFYGLSCELINNKADATMLGREFQSKAMNYLVEGNTGQKDILNGLGEEGIKTLNEEILQKFKTFIDTKGVDTLNNLIQHMVGSNQEISIYTARSRQGDKTAQKKAQEKYLLVINEFIKSFYKIA